MHDSSKLVARVLAGAWRKIPPALEISPAEIETVTPLLLQTGAAALGWRRVQFSNVRNSSAAIQLKEAYRYHSLQAAIRENQIQEVVELLASRGVEPVLVKGWAMARHYVEPGLRPYGDIDLCVGSDQYLMARTLLAAEGRRYRVDLHRAFTKFGNEPWHELYSRSRPSRIERVSVRILAAEDHLRLLCFHFLREGAWRPLWLCDIAVALEARSADFDWDLCLGPNARSREWVACTIGLARCLLQANVDGVPLAACTERMPSWLLPSVLKEWDVRSVYQRHRSPMASAWRRPIRFFRRLRYHWPSPIEATIHLNGRFNEAPRLPFQLGACALRSTNYLWRFPNGTYSLARNVKN
jgi:hypothetical protein